MDSIYKRLAEIGQRVHPENKKELSRLIRSLVILLDNHISKLHHMRLRSAVWNVLTKAKIENDYEFAACLAELTFFQNSCTDDKFLFELIVKFLKKEKKNPDAFFKRFIINMVKELIQEIYVELHDYKSVFTPAYIYTLVTYDGELKEAILDILTKASIIITKPGEEKLSVVNKDSYTSKGEEKEQVDSIQSN